MDDMKITIFISSMANSGGTERVAANLSALFAERGHIVQILVLRPSLKTFYDIRSDVTIHSLNINKRTPARTKLKYMWEIISNIRSYIRAEKPDAVLAIWTDLSIFSILAGIGLPTKIIACEHTNSQRQLVMHEKLRRFVYPIADAIVALTDTDRDFYLQMNKNSVVIPNAVRSVKLETDIMKEKTIISIGHIAPHKGFDMLIEAWNIAHKQLDGWSLKIIGADIDMEYKKGLLDRIDKYGLNSYIHVLPEVKDIFVEYQKASIFVLSSRREGLPMVIIEAMYIGLPVISFDCPTGPRELIKDRENGVLVANGNIQELARAIVDLAEDENLRNRYISNAQLSAPSSFGEKNIYQRWMRLLKSLYTE